VAVESRAGDGNYPQMTKRFLFHKNASVALALVAIVVVAPRGNAQHEDHAVMRDMPGDTGATAPGAGVIQTQRPRNRP